MLARLLVLLLILASCLAGAQTIPYETIDTIDVSAQTARTVVVGRLAEVVPGTPNSYASATVAVDKTLKGSSGVRVETARMGIANETLEGWRASGHRILLFAGMPPPHETRFVDLDDPRLAVPTADLTLLRRPDEALAYLRRALRARPFSETGVLPASIPAFFGPLGGERRWPRIAGYRVPADARLERWARDALRDAPLVALPLLRSFPSKANEARVRPFLHDPTDRLTAKPKDNLGIEVHDFPVRKAALDVLDLWGAKVERPVVHQEIPRYDTLEELDSGAELTEAFWAVLPRFKALRRITIYAYHLTDADLARLATVRTVEDLQVGGWSDIDDAGLAALKGMPRLATLNVGWSKITDAGLPTLAAIPTLRHLTVKVTKATPAGVEAFRRTRPDVTVESEPLGDRG